MKFFSWATAVFAAVGLFAAAGAAHAMTPSLSLVNTSGDSVQITVSGDSSKGVVFYYNLGSSSGSLSTSLGTTSASGTFTTTISSGGYAVNPGSLVYVVVNGQQSATQTWPYGTSSASTSGAPSLNPSSVTVIPGQTATVASQGTSNSVYLLSNSSPTTATVSVNGTQITVTGNQLGSATAVVCYVGSASNCSNLSITVGSGTSSGSVSFSQTNPSLTVGQLITLTISGGSGYYISGSTNSSVTSQTISGSTLSVTGLADGATTITVCSISNGCGSVNVTVGGVSSAAGQTGITFSVSNPTIAVGQALQVALSGSSSYNLSNNPNPNMVQASISGSTLTLTGVGAGSTFVTVCDYANSNRCNTIFFTVMTSLPTSGTSPAVSPTTTSVTPAQAVLPTQTPVSTSNTGEVLAAIQSMQSKLLQLVSEIQAMQNTLVQLVAKITPGAGVAPTAATSPASSKGYIFSSALEVGSKGREVTELQKRLIEGGFYSGEATGYYGIQTEAAVKKFQSAHGIPAQGNVGPSTRAALNSGQ